MSNTDGLDLAARRIALGALAAAIGTIALIVVAFFAMPPGSVRYWIIVGLGIAGVISIIVAGSAGIAMAAGEHWRVALIAAAGMAVAHGLAALVNLTMTPSFVRLANYTLVLWIGLALAGLVVWNRSRAMAGDDRRPLLVAMLAFLAVPQGQWQGLLPLKVHHITIPADFVLTIVAFGLAMVVYKWLAPINAREAAELNRPEASRGPRP